MTLTITEHHTTEGIPADLEAAWQDFQAVRYQHDARAADAALVRLGTAANAADHPLCQWGCLTPHDVTVRSCCQSAVCDQHDDEHDNACPEFIAQLREERY